MQMHDLDLLQYFHGELQSLNCDQKFPSLCVAWTRLQFTGEKFKKHWWYMQYVKPMIFLKAREYSNVIFKISCLNPQT